MDALPLVRGDALPEGLDSSDRGCRLHPSCLSCPEATCIFDLATRKADRIDRRPIRARRLRAKGWTSRQIAERLGVSVRQVFRYWAEK
ncbi:MAG: helix-turn-helix domain-containing protein [Hyphomicrobiaceae bacterium]